MSPSPTPVDSAGHFGPRWTPHSPHSGGALGTHLRRLQTRGIWLLLATAWLLLSLPLMARADTLLIAASAGYKRPLGELALAFERANGHHVEQLYGHMGSITAQARQTGQVAAILGDRAFLAKVDGVQITRWIAVGQGRLVIAWPRGGHLQEARDLADPRFARIAVPDIHAVIYGVAAMAVSSTERARNRCAGPVAGSLYGSAGLCISGQR